MTRRRMLAQLGAYLSVVAMFFFALWQIDQAHLHDEATSCVASWERTIQIRNMGEAVYRQNAKTLIAQSPEADPQRIAIYKAQVDRDVPKIRSKVKDPTCDLAAAKRRLQ